MICYRRGRQRSIQELAVETGGNHDETSIRVVGVTTEIRSGHIRKISQKL